MYAMKWPSHVATVTTIKHELRYDRRSKHWGVGFAKSDTTLLSYWIIKVWVDAAHAICPDTRRSRTGFFVTLNGNFLSYKCKLHPGVPSQSSTEVEYRALSDSLNEVIWIVMILKDLGIRVQKPIQFLVEDNQAAIKLGENKMSSHRSKHIDLRHHVVRYHNAREREYRIVVLSHIRNDCRYFDKVLSETEIRTPPQRSNDERSHRTK